jgi:hypothetical protein
LSENGESYKWEVRVGVLLMGVAVSDVVHTINQSINQVYQKIPAK